MNKRGLATLQIISMLFWFTFVVMFLGIGLFGFNQVNDVLDVDVDIGQVNLRDINADTFGALNSAFAVNADSIGLVILLGMSLLMIMNGFIFGDKNKLWIPIDLLVLVFCFIFSVYIAQIYDIFINSTSLFSLFIDDLPKSSAFILNLPKIVATLGTLIMIFTYAFPGKREEQLNAIGIQ